MVNRVLLEVAALLLSAWGLFLLVLKVTEKWWGTREGAIWRYFAIMLGNISDEKSKKGPTIDAPPQQSGNEAKTKKSAEWVIWLITPPLFLLMLYCLKAIMYIWDPRFGTAIHHSYVLIASVAGG